jgi:hypothetical protein
VLHAGTAALTGAEREALPEEAVRLAEDLVGHAAGRAQAAAPVPLILYKSTDIMNRAKWEQPYFVTGYDHSLHGFSDRGRIGETGENPAGHAEYLKPVRESVTGGAGNCPTAASCSAAARQCP